MPAHDDHRLQMIAVNCWNRIVGEETAAVTLVTACIDRTLSVLVPSKAWMEKLQPQTAQFVERMNHALLSPGVICGIDWSVAVAVSPEGQ